jgi:hypothetical protein
MGAATCFCGSSRNKLLAKGDWSYRTVNGHAVHFRALRGSAHQLMVSFRGLVAASHRLAESEEL